MRLESKKQERPDEPLSTSALAHVDEQREPENRANERAREPLVRREPESPVRETESPVRETERRVVDGGPRLMQPGAARTSEPDRVGNRMEGAANRQPVAAGKTPDQDQNTPLFSEQESRDLFARWDALQVGFIDEPRQAVQEADHLVAAAMKRTAEVFAEERARLERQWDQGDNVSTEDLRVAMRRYRSFFRRLLSI
jgi:hypothetical protein